MTQIPNLLLKAKTGGAPGEHEQVSSVEYITSLADLPTPAGGIITIIDSNKTYCFPVIVNLGVNKIVITGDSVRFCGFSGSQSGLTSTATGDMISAPNTFTCELMLINGVNASTLINCDNVAPTQSVAFINKNIFIGNPTTVGIYVSNFSTLIAEFNIFPSCGKGIFLENTVEGFIAEKNSFSGIADICIDLDSAFMFAVGISNNIANLAPNTTWLNIAALGANILAGGEGTVTNNKLVAHIDGVVTMSLDTNGIGVGMTVGTYDATQFSTTGGGTGAVFNVTIDAVGSTTINYVVNAGNGYIVGEDITLDISGETFSTRPVVNVDSIGDSTPITGYSPFDLDWLMLGNNDIVSSDRVSPTGWGFYADTATPVTDDITVTTSDTQFTVDSLGGTTEEGYLPKAIRGIGSLWAGDLITPMTLGDGLDLRVQFDIISVSGAPSRIDLKLDIGGGGSIVIVSDSKAIKNTTPQTVVFSFPIFALATFLANGGKLNVAVDTGTAVINNRTVLLQRTSSGAT